MTGSTQKTIIWLALIALLLFVVAAYVADLALKRLLQLLAAIMALIAAVYALFTTTFTSITKLFTTASVIVPLTVAGLIWGFLLNFPGIQSLLSWLMPSQNPSDGSITPNPTQYDSPIGPDGSSQYGFPAGPPYLTSGDNSDTGS